MLVWRVLTAFALNTSEHGDAAHPIIRSCLFALLSEAIQSSSHACSICMPSHSSPASVRLFCLPTPCHIVCVDNTVLLAATHYALKHQDAAAAMKLFDFGARATKPNAHGVSPLLVLLRRLQARPVAGREEHGAAELKLLFDTKLPLVWTKQVREAAALTARSCPKRENGLHSLLRLVGAADLP